MVQNGTLGYFYIIFRLIGAYHKEDKIRLLMLSIIFLCTGGVYYVLFNKKERLCRKNVTYAFQQKADGQFPRNVRVHSIPKCLKISGIFYPL
jgi:hypothetical protein